MLRWCVSLNHMAGHCTSVQHYKGIAFELERFMRKAKVEFKIPGLYLINAVCTASKKKFQDKVPCKHTVCVCQ